MLPSMRALTQRVFSQIGGEGGLDSQRMALLVSAVDFVVPYGGFYQDRKG